MPSARKFVHVLLYK